MLQLYFGVDSFGESLILTHALRDTVCTTLSVGWIIDTRVASACVFIILCAVTHFRCVFSSFHWIYQTVDFDSIIERIFDGPRFFTILAIEQDIWRLHELIFDEKSGSCVSTLIAVVSTAATPTVDGNVRDDEDDDSCDDTSSIGVADGKRNYNSADVV